MAFPRNLVNEGEELVLDLRPHWFFMFEPTISLVGAVLLGIIVITHDPPSWLSLPVGLLVLGVLVWWGIRYAKWVTTNFVVTDRRVVYRSGVLAKKGIEIPLERINTVTFSQSIFERMIGAGDLGIESASRDGAETFNDVRKPSNVQNEIYRQMEGHTQRTYGGVQAVNQATQAAQAAAASAAGATTEKSIPEQLRALDELRQQGVLTQAEFDAKKAQLLERM
jgi:uncharacterized membrane protein YdbT with pleckstrin-like domain